MISVPSKPSVEGIFTFQPKLYCTSKNNWRGNRTVAILHDFKCYRSFYGQDCMEELCETQGWRVVEGSEILSLSPEPAHLIRVWLLPSLLVAPSGR